MIRECDRTGCLQRSHADRHVAGTRVDHVEDSGTHQPAGHAAFAIALPSLYVHGFGRNTTPFASTLAGLDGSLGWLGPHADCKIVDGVVRGCGFFEKLEDNDQGQSIEERAVAWFARV